MHAQNTNLFNFIKQHVQILEIINEHVALKRAGHYWKGRCPFHDEKTASFTVSPHREIFYCFGCHAGGDVITFVTKVENCSALEAARYLAERYNITIPETVALPELGHPEEKKRYFDMCGIFAQWTASQLTKYPSVKNYLHNRGITDQSIAQFQTGYFPSGERAVKTLVQEFNKHNFLVKDLLEFHLIEEGKATLYSPFEDRIIFPIKDHLGRFCGFGGRIFKEADQRPKYYNSRENSYFQKGSLLFGFDKAKNSIQKTGHAFLVEGYTDCIAMVQNSLANTVATLGTACTLEHLKQLAYHAQTVFLVYDADMAGQRAMLRLAELCWQVNLDLKTIVLPAGHDPASFLTEGGDLQGLIPGAQDILLFFLTSMGKEFAHQGLQDKLIAVRKVIEIIKNLDDPLKQDMILQSAATTFGMPFESLKDELKRAHLKKVQPPFGNHSGLGQIPGPESSIQDISPIEKKFVCAILNEAQLLERKEVQLLVGYIAAPLRDIVNKIEKNRPTNERDSFILFFDTLEYNEKQLVNQLLLSSDEQKQQEDIETILLMLEKQHWKKIVVDTKEQILAAQQEQNAQRVNEIVVSFSKLKQKLLHRGLI